MKIDPIKNVNTFVRVFPEQRVFDKIIDISKIDNIKLGGDNEDNNKLYYLA